jgi:hypothetical protein
MAKDKGPNKEVAEKTVISKTVGDFFMVLILYIIIAIWYSMAKFCIGQTKHPKVDVLDQYDINLLLKFHQTITSFASKLSTGTTKSSTSVDEAETIRNDILKIVKTTILNTTDTTPISEIVDKLLTVVNSEASGELIANIEFPPSVVPEELKFSQLYPNKAKDSPSNIIDKFLFEIFYPTYNLIFTNSGTCFFLDKITADIVNDPSNPLNTIKLEKPLLIQHWINKLVLSTGINSDTTTITTMQHFNIASSYATKMAANTLTAWDVYKPDTDTKYHYIWSIITSPIIFIFTILLSVLYVFVSSYSLYSTAVVRKSMITDNSSIRGILILLGFPAVLFHCVYLIKYLGLDCMVDIFEHDTLNGFVTRYTLDKLWWDIFSNIPMDYASVGMALFLISIVLILSKDTSGAGAPQLAAILTGAFTAGFIVIYKTWKFQYNHPETCKNGWYDSKVAFYDTKCDTTKQGKPAVTQTSRLLLSDATPAKSIMPTDKWFSLFPSVSVGNIIPYNMTEMRILNVVSLLPSPLPKWITISDPIHANRISKRIPMLMDKLKVIYAGLQQILTTYNDGSIMINDLIAYVHDTIDATQSASPATVESDMQIRETLSLLFNLLNLYLATHWYYSNQTEMTTFIFNVRNNLILIHRSISLEAEDIKILDNKKFVDDIIDIVNTIFIKERVFPKYPIILPDNVYETYRQGPSPITTQMPWLLPKLKIVFDYIPYVKHQTMLGNTVSKFKEEDLINKLKSSKSIEIDDFYLDYTISAILRNINTYLIEYINKWLLNGPPSEIVTSFDIETYSYKYARRFFVIAYRLRYLYNILTTYQGAYDKEVINNIRTITEGILVDMDASNMIKDENPIPITHTKIPATITFNSISDILSLLQTAMTKDTKDKEKKEVDAKYKRIKAYVEDKYVKTNDIVDKAITALKNNTSPSTDTINDVQQYIEEISTKILDNSRGSTDVVKATFDWRLACEEKIRELKTFIQTTNPSFKNAPPPVKPTSVPTLSIQNPSTMSTNSQTAANTQPGTTTQNNVLSNTLSAVGSALTDTKNALATH